MMEVKNIGNHNKNLIEDTRNQNTSSWCSLFLLGLKLKTKQCKELRSWSLPKQQCSNHLWSKVKHLESKSDVHVHCIVAWILHHERKFDTLFCCSVACILHHHCKKPQNNIFHINNPQSKKFNLTLTSNPKPWCLALVCVVDVCPTYASWHFAKHDTCQGTGMTYVSEKQGPPRSGIVRFFIDSCPAVRAPNTLVYALVDTRTKIDTRPLLVQSHWCAGESLADPLSLSLTRVWQGLVGGVCYCASKINK